MEPEALVARWLNAAAAPAIVWNDHTFGYRELASAVEQQRRALRECGVAPGSVVTLEADVSPAAIAVLFALWLERMIVLPLVPAHLADENRGSLLFCDW